MEEVFQRAARVDLVVFDVDGVLTDRRLYFGDDGVELKAFDARDGHGIKMLQRTGIEVAIITGRRSSIVSQRMGDLGITHVVQGQEAKGEGFAALLAELDLSAERAAFVGDDVLDLPPMRAAGLAVAVADAHPLVRRHAHWCTPSRGGRGAAREVCELLMEAQGTLEAQLAPYLE